MQWQKVSLIGVGLLGGSLGLALKRPANAPRVVGYVRRRESLKECVRRGAVDAATMDLDKAVSGADLVVLCTPIAKMAELVHGFLPGLRAGAIVTDVGSVKASVVAELEAVINRAGGHFVGSHPMAGSEKMGVSAATADLFQNTVCVVTPTAKTNSMARRRVQQLWKSVGARAMLASPEAHDQWVSRTSHLPYLAATVLAHSVLDPAAPKQHARLCASGFRDTTRIASGSPEMWRDIALANRQQLRKALKSYIADLSRLEKLLAQGDERALTRLFTEAKHRRDQWLKQSTASSPE